MPDARAEVDVTDTLGSRLRRLRIDEPYLTVRQAAVLLHSDARWLSDVEADRIKPTPGALDDLARAYGVDLRDLIPLWEQWTQAPPLDLTNSICTGRRT